MFSEAIKNVSVIVVLLACIRLFFLLLRECIIRYSKNVNEKTDVLGISETVKAGSIPFFTIVCWAILSRIVIYIIAFMGLMFFKDQADYSLKTFEWMCVKWDSFHFLNIAKHWYQNTGDERFLIGFYPVYPIFIKLLTIITKNYFLSSVLVSNISFIITAIYLYKLARIDFNEETSIRAVKYFLFYPFSFFLAMTFTDSLFLAFTTAAFYNLRKKRWLVCGILGGFASGTRNYGLVFLIPAFIEYILESDFFVNLKNKDFVKIVSNIKAAYFLFIIPLGFVSLLCINKVVTGEWFKFMTYAREHWNCGVGFWGDTIKMLTNNSFTWTPNASIALWIPQIVSIMVMLILILYSFNKIRISYTAYMIGYFLLTTAPTWLLSSSRYTMGLWPIYILLGIISRNTTLDCIMTFTSIMLLCFYTLIFTQGSYVM